MSAPVTAGLALAVLADPLPGARVQVFDRAKGFWRVGTLLRWSYKKYRHHVVKEVAEVLTLARARPFKVTRENIRPCPR